MDGLRERIRRVLEGFEDGGLRERAEDLLRELGYGSERFVELEPDPEAFLAEAAKAGATPIARSQRELVLEHWERVAMVFQLTGDELSGQATLFGAPTEWEKGRQKSFLFLAVDLKPGDHPRSRLAAMTRAANRPFAMPAIVFFRHDRAREGRLRERDCGFLGADRAGGRRGGVLPGRGRRAAAAGGPLPRGPAPGVGRGAELDRKVYALYGLTPEQIALVEGAE